ncbi:hypothetical protein Tdes44962_MAKER09763 [Teratosphaeria destructans]|uniref:Uncharacterized protein n=1 Tax=Teratosphaeria destructans TaxID=418781 RepID=A0A9W7W2C5_9PEZI|nr:hypothetical protein Tdes44962_MAKER09763 [Teratosphaeria destructans]
MSGKSWAWRATYHEVLMLLARAAEHLDGMVLDTTRGIVFPRAVMIGPSNPDPRPVPAYMSAAPREENCVGAFDPPDLHYMHVITRGGFTTRQRLEAVAAYANWLEYKGRTERAEEVLTWGVDAAKMGLDRNVKAEEVMDDKTFVLKPEAVGSVTENLLTATTNLAIHRARNNDLASALPILLSVLRARRSAPVSPFPQPEPTESSPTPSSILAKIFQPSRFPPPPPSGDLPLIRSSEKPTCEESELMLYIGEILFATSPTASDAGLNWTRQAVAIAEANLQDLKSKPSSFTPETAAKCTQCLHTGLENWETMLRQLSSSTASTKDREGGRDAGWFEWRGWFGADGGGKGRVLEDTRRGVLEEELRRVEGVRERLMRDGIAEVIGRNAGSRGWGCEECLALRAGWLGRCWEGLRAACGMLCVLYGRWCDRGHMGG